MIVSAPFRYCLTTLQEAVGLTGYGVEAEILSTGNAIFIPMLNVRLQSVPALQQAASTDSSWPILLVPVPSGNSVYAGNTPAVISGRRSQTLYQ